MQVAVAVASMALELVVLVVQAEEVQVLQMWEVAV
jgi:hypothetical protein